MERADPVTAAAAGNASGNRAASGALPAAQLESVAVPTSRQQLLGDVLAATVANLRPAPAGHWRFNVAGTRRIAAASLDDRWLSFELGLGSGGAPSLLRIQRYLRRNPALPGGVRIVTGRSSPASRYVLDMPADALPWDEPEELLSAAGAALADLRGAVRVSVVGNDAAGPAAGDAGELAELFEEAEWPLQSAGNPNAAVPLDVPGYYMAADVSRACDGIVMRARVLPVELESAAAVCRDAVAAHLWFSAGAMKMVRPAIHGKGLELSVTVALAPAAIRHGCAALSVALRRCCAETQHLVADEELAGAYLSTVGLQRGPRVPAASDA